MRRRRNRSRGPRAWHVVAATVAVLVFVLVLGEGARLVGDAAEREGIDAFYAQPVDAAAGEPGSLIAAEALSGVPFITRAWRILYRSTTAAGDPVAVSGIVVSPAIPPPDGPRTVLAWAHPTTGAARECAPSYGFDPFIGIEGMRMFLDRGYTVVATDYAGMGVAGPDSYLVGGTEGRNVLDAVLAAAAIPDAHAGTDVVVWGHSQGGQAALFAAEEARDYAPGLDVRAVAVAAPAADLTTLMSDHLDDISGVTIGSYAFTAFAETYGGDVPGADLADVLTPAAQGIVPEMNALCLLSDLGELHRIGEPLVGDFTSVDPTTTSPWQQLLSENSAGSRAFDAPLFIAQGLDDQLILPAATEAFVAHERALGIDVTYHTVGWATHSTIAYAALPALELWLDGILD
ncbi:alpha/beta fold hydrolase [Microbacterium radiodurans]|uniref:Alpha/beta fold hydrolase n=1 Tax=Microbacterium radiodurans TaxID=661398 RepID=A0A5J5ISB6_9MICO|nr:alpha/beta fold hydrolase [Microbacterium radiodurans]KAA9089054.1 alpha/beta fold hydrolase [Microbacterium radiodurans]